MVPSTVLFPMRVPALILSTAAGLTAATAQAAGAHATVPPVAPSPYVLQVPSGTTADSAANPYRLDARYRPAPPPEPVREVAASLAEKPFAREIETSARDAKVDPALVHAIVHVESRHRQEAVSPKGAIGLMQVMPATAQRYGVKAPAKSAEENLKAGTRYLKDLLEMFDGKLDLVLAAYNAGEGAVMRYKAVPPYRETKAYVPAVLAKYAEWKLPELKLEQRFRSAVYLDGTRANPDLIAGFRRAGGPVAD